MSTVGLSRTLELYNVRHTSVVSLYGQWRGQFLCKNDLVDNNVLTFLKLNKELIAVTHFYLQKTRDWFISF